MSPGAAEEGRFYKARDEVSVQSGGMGRGRKGSGRAGDGLGEYVVGASRRSTSRSPACGRQALGS